MLFAAEFYAARRAVEQGTPDALDKVQILAGCLYSRPDCPVSPDLLVDLAEQMESFPGQRSVLLSLLDIIGRWLAETETGQQETIAAQEIGRQVVAGVTVGVLSTIILYLLGVT